MNKSFQGSSKSFDIIWQLLDIVNGRWLYALIPENKSPFWNNFDLCWGQMEIIIISCANFMNIGV